jgi:hypothetical protein
MSQNAPLVNQPPPSFIQNFLFPIFPSSPQTCLNYLIRRRILSRLCWMSQIMASPRTRLPRRMACLKPLSDRLRGLPSRSEVTQPAQLLSKSQESRLVTWILRQEALGYAPSHSQVRATVAALLRQQGRERHIGVHWLARFIKRHPDIETKVGKR